MVMDIPEEAERRWPKNTDYWTGWFDDARRLAFTQGVEWARKQTLIELANKFEQPRVLWHGDGGVQVCVDERLTLIPISEWLRALAEGDGSNG